MITITEHAKIRTKERLGIEDFIRLHTCGFDIDFMKRYVHERNTRNIIKSNGSKEI